MNIIEAMVVFADETPVYVNKVWIENVEGYAHLFQPKRHKENNQDNVIQLKSQPAGQHTPHTGISAKAALPSAWIDGSLSKQSQC